MPLSTQNATLVSIWQLVLRLICVPKTSSPNPPAAVGLKNGPSALHVRKQQFAHDEIWATAIDLFAAKGFDETTVDEIAQASGVSRRSFFRYYSSKNDLMAQGILGYGVLVTEAINSCPREYSPAEILRKTVLLVVQRAAAHPRTRMIMEIAAKYPAAKEAQSSRLGEVQARVAEVFASRCKQTRRGDLTPNVFAALTLALIETALQSWFHDGRQPVSTTVKQIFATVDDLWCKHGVAG